jgi:hypothetical protein
MRIKPIVCHHCKGHSWTEPLPVKRDWPFPRDRWWERLWHRTIRGEVRCCFATTTQHFPTEACSIVTNYVYTREVPEQCPKKFEHVVAMGMK